MAKSYKPEFMKVIESCMHKYEIDINGRKIPLYSNNKLETITNTVNLEEIIKAEGLKGATKPIAIIQYVTYIPWTDNLGPMIAFVWSWGGPWAYVHNIQFPSYSESGAVPYHRFKQFAGMELHETYFRILG